MAVALVGPKKGEEGVDRLEYISRPHFLRHALRRQLPEGVLSIIDDFVKTRFSSLRLYDTNIGQYRSSIEYFNWFCANASSSCYPSSKCRFRIECENAHPLTTDFMGNLTCSLVTRRELSNEEVIAERGRCIDRLVQQAITRLRISLYLRLYSILENAAEKDSSLLRDWFWEHRILSSYFVEVARVEQRAYRHLKRMLPRYLLQLSNAAASTEEGRLIRKFIDIGQQLEEASQGDEIPHEERWHIELTKHRQRRERGQIPGQLLRRVLGIFERKNRCVALLAATLNLVDVYSSSRRR